MPGPCEGLALATESLQLGVFDAFFAMAQSEPLLASSDFLRLMGGWCRPTQLEKGQPRDLFDCVGEPSVHVGMA